MTVILSNFGCRSLLKRLAVFIAAPLLPAAVHAVLALAAGRIEETGHAAFLRVNTVSMGI